MKRKKQNKEECQSPSRGICLWCLSQEKTVGFLGRFFISLLFPMFCFSLCFVKQSSFWHFCSMLASEKEEKKICFIRSYVKYTERNEGREKERKTHRESTKQFLSSWYIVNKIKPEQNRTNTKCVRAKIVIKTGENKKCEAFVTWLAPLLCYIVGLNVFNFKYRNTHRKTLKEIKKLPHFTIDFNEKHKNYQKSEFLAALHYNFSSVKHTKNNKPFLLFHFYLFFKFPDVVEVTVVEIKI